MQPLAGDSLGSRGLKQAIQGLFFIRIGLQGTRAFVDTWGGRTWVTWAVDRDG